jgi:hypothetical protein
MGLPAGRGNSAPGRVALRTMGGADTAGIALGARVPMVLTSRADARDARPAFCAIAVMLAHRCRASPP